MDQETRKPFWDHVYEIRNRLFVVLASATVFAVACWFLFPLYFPVIRETLGEQLFALDLTAGFAMRMKLSALLGLVCALPVMVFEIMLFLLPALDRKQKTYLFVFLASAFILFILGVVFAFQSILPVSIQFLRSEEFFPAGISRMVSYESYVDFFFQFLAGFGLCFEFPMALLALIRFRVLTVRALARNFKYILVLILIVAAILTPDVISQLVLAVPMTALYGLTLLVGKFIEPKGDK